jgi:alanine racemase
MIDAFAAAAGGEQVPVHLKVDTGMGRFGCRPDEARHLAEAITRSRNLRLAGTWTHFASADTDAVMTQRQFDLFQRVLADIGVDPGLRHACNSAGALRYPAMALDAVRIGIAMYGCEGDGLQPVLRLRAPVAQVKKLQPGDTVGYGATWRAARASLLATVAIGYADGVLRSRANTGWALVRGRRAPLAGRVSMDAISVDVTDIPGVETGDLATLIGEDGGERITAEMVAGWSGSISYEVLTAIGPRVHREYVE